MSKYKNLFVRAGLLMVIGLCVVTLVKGLEMDNGGLFIAGFFGIFVCAKIYIETIE